MNKVLVGLSLSMTVFSAFSCFINCNDELLIAGTRYKKQVAEKTEDHQQEKQEEGSFELDALQKYEGNEEINITLLKLYHLKKSKK